MALFLLACLAIVASCSTPTRRRDFVIALWRHGARSPTTFDPYVGDDFEMWPDGMGQLSSLGVEHHQGILYHIQYMLFSEHYIIRYNSPPTSLPRAIISVR